MEQLFLEQVIEKKAVKNCVFTGHRILEKNFSVRKLKKEIKKAVEAGVETFYNGMAMGFDLVAAEKVLELRKKNPQIKLIACVPCYGQEKNFSDKDKKRYVAILKKADETVVLSENYYKGCMLVRDKYMADRGEMMICYCKRDTGGAAYTVKYFKKIKPLAEIVYI
jgi:uncharacterized phage-like protein YoqJ